MKYLVKFSLIGLALALFISAVVFMRAFFLTDLSKTPLEKELKEAVYLVSYADGPDVFHKNQKMLVYSGIQKGISYFFNYNKKLIDPKFLENHKDIFSKKAGAGLWLWKPWLIMDALKKTPENSYVFYIDSGFVIKRNLNPILDSLKTHDMVLVYYPNKKEFGTLGQSAKRQALIKTNCDTKECFDAPLVWAGMIFMKNTPRTRNFVNKWLTYCEDPQLLSDSPGPYREHAGKRIFHHYDQSLLSITYHQNPEGIALISNMDVAYNNILRWHHRHPSNQDESLFFDYNKISALERYFINLPMFRKIAGWLYSL
ncbi:MAG: hypothetical protein WCG05_03420 [Alphaproteobacteria bacterium]